MHRALTACHCTSQQSGGACIGLAAGGLAASLSVPPQPLAQPARLPKTLHQHLPHQQASHPGARSVTLVDVPGHPRVRGAMDRYADRAAGLVFVVDSVDFMPRKTEAAE